MAITSPPTDFTGIMGNLAALSGQQEDNKRKAMENYEFLQTQESRKKKKIAENELGTISAEMGKEVQEDRQKEQRHLKTARATDVATEKKAQAEGAGAENDMRYEILSGITDESSHKQAFFKLQELGVPPDASIALIGDAYDPDQIAGTLEGIRYRRADQAKLAEVAQKERSTDVNAAVGRAEIAARLAIAQADVQAAMAAASTKAKDTGKWDINDSPFKDPIIFAEAIRNKLGVDAEEGEIKTRSAEAWAAYKLMELGGYNRANQFMAANPGVPLPASIDPGNLSKLWMQRAQRVGSGEVADNPERERYSQKEKGYYDLGRETMFTPDSAINILWSQPRYSNYTQPEILNEYVKRMMWRDTQNVTNTE